MELLIFKLQISDSHLFLELFPLSMYIFRIFRVLNPQAAQIFVFVGEIISGGIKQRLAIITFTRAASPVNLNT